MAGCGGGEDLGHETAAAKDAGFAEDTVLDSAVATPSSVLDLPAPAADSREQAMALNAGSPISSNHLLAQAETTPLFSSQKWQVQCDGVSTKIWNIPETGLHGTRLEDGSTLKFGRAADPVDGSRKTLIFRVNPRNQEVANAHRCEGTFNDDAQSIQNGDLVWQAFRIYLPDWSNTYKNDGQTVAQWHHRDYEYKGLQPAMAMNITHNVLRFNVRFSTAAVPTNDNIVTKNILLMKGGFQKRWLDVVIQSRVSNQASHNPFMKIWINGQQVANYTGPVGYNLPRGLAAKFGIYKYGSASWDMSIPTREVRFQEMMLVRDPNRAYTEPMLRAELSR